TTIPVYQTHLCRWWLCRREDGARRLANWSMEAGDREAIRRSWICGLAQKVDCRKDLRLDQSQSPAGSRLRALRYDRRRLRPPRHDPHHAQAACCKRLVMNPNFPDGFLGLLDPCFLVFGVEYLDGAAARQ